MRPLASFALLASVAAAACAPGAVPPRPDAEPPAHDANASPDSPAPFDAPADAPPAADAPIAADAPAPPDAPMCPAGVGMAWSCDAARMARRRCTAGVLETIACEYGCNAPDASTGDATCSCGPHTGFTLWNCTADGDLHRCTAGAYETRSCMGRGCRAQPLGVDDICAPPPGTAPLQPVLDRLGGVECAAISPGTRCGLAVHDLASDEVAQYQGDRWFVSASSVKAVWVAAALHDTSVAAVMPYAEPVFARSDNYASGSVIDLLSSPARVNTFMWESAGMPNSGFCHWNYGRTRDASNCPATAGGDNFFTANDAVEFLSRLYRRTLLASDATDAELSWMQLSPRSGYGGWLGTQLPSAAQMTMRHKAGWLPPTEVPGYTNSNEIGIIEYAPGRVYTVATLMNGGSNYDGRQLPLMEYASCVIYHAVARDTADPFGAPCHHP